jgi:signal transduction histidine kinase
MKFGQPRNTLGRIPAIAPLSRVIAAGPLYLLVFWLSLNFWQTAVAFPSLTNAAQIRELKPELAQRGLPVHLRAVVTYHDLVRCNMFVQDDTAGIFVHPGFNSRASSELTGQEVEVLGITGKGDYAPIIQASAICPVGEGHLPAPRQASFDELAAGSEDSQWIEVRGVVRSTAIFENRQHLNFFMNGQRLAVSVKDLKEQEARQLLNAKVRLRGVCYSRVNERRQFRTPWLAVSSMADVLIEQLPAGDAEEVSIAGLSQFNSQGYYSRRVKVTGAVTLQRSDGSFFIQHNENGLWVRPTMSERFSSGDRVTVCGYSTLHDYMPILEDASVASLRKGEALPPRSVPLETLLNTPEIFAGVLVRLEGRLVNRMESQARQTLILQSSNSVFSAHLENSHAEEHFKTLKLGSTLAVAGVFVAQSPEKWIPNYWFPPADPAQEKTVPAFHLAPAESIQIHLRSIADIAVLRQPPWWTLARLLWTLGIMSFILLAGVCWVVVLDRRVRHQTRIIQQKVKREGVLEERDRIAREFHDTLEQEIAAIIIQLDAVEMQFNSSPKTARQLLGLARDMSRHSLAEARRSVRDLRSRLLENSDLPTALKEMAAPLSPGNGTEITVQTSGAPRKLPALAEHHLLRVAQEGIVNSLKHARAKKIAVTLRYEANQVYLCIRDDGDGFDLACVGSASGGCFGLLDMRERAEKIGARFTLTSKPGNGAEVVFAFDEKSLVEPRDDSSSRPELSAADNIARAGKQPSTHDE